MDYRAALRFLALISKIGAPPVPFGRRELLPWISGLSFQINVHPVCYCKLSR
jgi:hypothetical protein